jgi:hypothetical protein
MPMDAELLRRSWEAGWPMKDDVDGRQGGEVKVRKLKISISLLSTTYSWLVIVCTCSSLDKSTCIHGQLTKSGLVPHASTHTYKYSFMHTH